MLGGVEIPHSKGLLGHSDADVLIHAIADALLGTVGAGDIGHHFPNTDESIRGIRSTEILARVVDILAGFATRGSSTSTPRSSPKHPRSRRTSRR